MLELGERYPGDAGVLAAMLLNRMHLEPGEAIYLPAGNLHAYLRGVGVEVMANSDNVLRGGLTPKHVDVPELLRVLDFTRPPRRRCTGASTATASNSTTARPQPNSRCQCSLSTARASVTKSMCPAATTARRSWCAREGAAVVSAKSSTIAARKGFRCMGFRG